MSNEVAIGPWPQQRTGEDGTYYWIDSGGQVFSSELHAGPQDDALGVDADGRWLPLKKRRGPKPGFRRAPKDQEADTTDEMVWVVMDDSMETCDTTKILIVTRNPEKALEVLVEYPKAVVVRGKVTP